MDQITPSFLFETIKAIIDAVVSVLLDLAQPFIEFFDSLPVYVKTFLYIAFIFAVIGILTSHVLGIFHNRREWKPRPGGRLMFSYFCGTGTFQWNKAYREAFGLLADRRWSWASPAGLAYRLGNFEHDSKLLLFACSLLYLPLAILGFVEMAIRIILGTIWLLVSGMVHGIALFVLWLGSCLLIPLWNIADSIARVEQHCPHCYKSFGLPGFICPSCGTMHKQLIPSLCGILAARCECGRFLPGTAVTGRSKLKAVCPECGHNLIASNASQFSIQVIGGNSSGKTAFLSAFQHVYLARGTRTSKFSISGTPKGEHEQFERMFKSGITEPSSPDTVTVYNLVHSYRRKKRHKLVFYDMPDEVILSGAYETNQLHFEYSDGIIIIVDPLSFPMVRGECQREGDNKAAQNYSLDDIGTMIIQFSQQFSDVVGYSARRMIDTPVAVVINKSDIKTVKRKVGLPRIKTTYSANPGNYNNDISVARDAICREYLESLGLGNVLNNLDAKFSNVRYFSMSAIGHISAEGKPFEPFGVIDPVKWIAKEGKAKIHPIISEIP